MNSVSLWGNVKNEEWKDLVNHCKSVSYSFSLSDFFPQDLELMQVIPWEGSVESFQGICYESRIQRYNKFQFTG